MDKNHSEEQLAIFSEGREMYNLEGTFWEFNYETEVLFPATRNIDSLYFYLQAVTGIGPKREAHLKSEGICSLQDLVRQNNPLSSDTPILLKALANQDWPLIYKRFPRFSVLCSIPQDKIAVLDIETTGFGFGKPIFLIGLLLLRPKCQLKLFLARHPAEEAAMLQAVTTELKDKIAVITYNGASFDLPALHRRAERYDIKFPPMLNMDLLPVVRRLLGSELPNCRLKTIEKIILEYERHSDPASSEVPEIYHQFLMEQDPNLLDEVISHNARDLESLVEIWQYLDERERR